MFSVSTRLLVEALRGERKESGKMKESKDEAKKSHRHTVLCVSISHHCLPRWEGCRSQAQLSTSMRDSAHLPLAALQAQTFAINRKIACSLIQAQCRLTLRVTIIKDSQSNHLRPSLDSHSMLFF